MYKSINEWSFPAGMDIRAMMELAKKQGFEGFEPAIGEEGALSLTSPDSAFIGVKNAAADIGIKLASLASGLSWKYPPSSNDPAIRQKASDNLRRQLDGAALLGVDAILLVPGSVGVGFWGADNPVEYDQCWDRAVAGVSALKAHAESVGVMIGIENVWNNFLMSPLEMAQFVDLIDSPRVGVYLDVGNIIKYGEPESWIRILGKRICRIHVKDYRRSVGTLDGFVDLLSGDVNFPKVVAALREIGYEGPLTAEMGVGRVYPEDIIYRTARALELILGER